MREKRREKHEKKAAPDSKKSEALLGDTETTGYNYKNQELGIAHAEATLSCGHVRYYFSHLVNA